jgi:hypothetical protein
MHSSRKEALLKEGQITESDTSGVPIMISSEWIELKAVPL